MGESTALWTQLLTGLGLAGAAGLNAYVPLLGVALLARAQVLTLAPPFDLLTHPWVMGVLVVLLLLELVVDKIPVADHVNDVVQTFIRPAAGALLFVGGSGAAGHVPPVALVIAGLVAAFGVHATKATVRPAVNAASFGAATPLVSAAEDVASAGTTLVAVFAPVLVILLLVGLALGVWWFARRATPR
jgi:hypothetical protein